MIKALLDAIYSQLFGGGVISSGLYGGTSALLPTLRTPRAAAADLTGATNIFTIAGGPILLLGLYGIRTVIQGGGASNISFQHSTGPTALCIATATTGIDPVGTAYAVPGDNTDALIIGAGGAVANTFTPLDPGRLVATSLQYGGAPMFMLGVGTITVTFSAAAPTGSTRYVIIWQPVDTASTVVAA